MEKCSGKCECEKCKKDYKMREIMRLMMMTQGDIDGKVNQIGNEIGKIIERHDKIVGEKNEIREIESREIFKSLKEDAKSREIEEI